MPGVVDDPLHTANIPGYDDGGLYAGFDGFVDLEGGFFAGAGDAFIQIEALPAPDDPEPALLQQVLCRLHVATPSHQEAEERAPVAVEEPLEGVRLAPLHALHQALVALALRAAHGPDRHRPSPPVLRMVPGSGSRAPPGPLA